jgi:hypothetical protein
MGPDSAQKSRPETSHAQGQMDERGENDRDFSIDAKMQDVRGVSAVPPEAPSEAEAPGRVNGTEGSERR